MTVAGWEAKMFGVGWTTPAEPVLRGFRKQYKPNNKLVLKRARQKKAMPPNMLKSWDRVHWIKKHEAEEQRRKEGFQRRRRWQSRDQRLRHQQKVAGRWWRGWRQ